MKRDWKYTVLVIAVLTALGLTGCGQQTQQAEQPQLVKAIQVGSETAGTTAGTYSGTVKGRYQSNLSFQAGGRITARNVQLGSQVHAGDVLMTVDAAAAQLQLAQSNLTRYQQLYDMDAISASVLDQYQTAYDQASAQYNQALAAQQAQENQLSYTQLTADADGVISAVSAEVGQVVAAGQTVVTLVHSGDLEVQVNVPENKLADFPVGKNVTVTFWALQNQQAAGVVREVAPMADAASRTYQVNISLPNPPDGMQLGMTATVANGSEQAAAEDTFVLPLAAIYQTGDTPQVWVVGKDKTLSLKDVTVQDFGDNTVKVTGLSRGDVVVTAGVHMLSEGQKVRVEGEDE